MLLILYILDGRTYESYKDDIKFAVGLSALNIPNDTKTTKTKIK